MVSKLIANSKYVLKYNYYITDDGQVWSELSNRFLSTSLDKDGYEKVRLMSVDNQRHRYSIHRIVLENFFPVIDMEILQVNHKDGNKLNNSLLNLEWVTCQENIIHAINNNLRATVNGSAKLTEKEVLEIIKLLLSKQFTNKQIAQSYQVNEETIGRIKRKQSWKSLTQNIFF